MITFEGRAAFGHVVGRVGGPWREHHVADGDSVRSDAEVEAAAVEEEGGGWWVVELRDELLDVRRRAEHRRPREVVGGRGRSWEVVGGRRTSWDVVGGRGTSWEVVGGRGR